MFSRFLCRVSALLMVLLLLASGALALTNEERSALFDEALAYLLTPDQLSDETGLFPLHPGDSAYAPCVSPGVVPFDQQGEEGLQPTQAGTFASSDESVAMISSVGLVTALAEGEAEITCETSNGTFTYLVQVDENHPPRTVQNYIYVLNREFYAVQRKKLPKYNQYAKWYYGRRKEVGWCAVFTIYCANASGNNPITLKQVDNQNPPMVQFFRQGQVGHQYDGFWAMDRFVSVPKPGYLVIYADMSNGYRTVHVGSVTDVQDLGGGRYAVTTVEGNMSNSIKSYGYLYDSSKANNTVGKEKGRKLQNNMEMLPDAYQVDPLVQYELHTDHWSVFGFCQTWK